MGVRIYGNRLLKTLPGQATRPTAARVREALFNIWRDRVAGCRWLDLCVGSGAMGAEALCRGAVKAIGIDQSGQACAIARQNWQQVAEPDQSFQVLRGDVVKRLKQLATQEFDLIYFDPPYESDLYEPVLAAIVKFHLLSDRGELAVEHSAQRSILLADNQLKCCRSKIYGSTALSFFQNNASTCQSTLS